MSPRPDDQWAALDLPPVAADNAELLATLPAIRRVNRLNLAEATKVLT